MKEKNESLIQGISISKGYRPRAANEIPRQGGIRSSKSNSSSASIPEKIADKIHYYGIIETPSDLIGFYCGGYKIKETTIKVKNLLLDPAVTRKSYITRIGGIFFKKFEFINYMGMFFPYIPYKYRNEMTNDNNNDK